jgi:hypothetical protein
MNLILANKILTNATTKNNCFKIILKIILKITISTKLSNKLKNKNNF